MFLIFLNLQQAIPIVIILKYIGMMIISLGERLLIIVIQLLLILLQIFLNLVIIIGLIQQLKHIKYGQKSQLMVNLLLLRQIFIIFF